MSSSSLSTSVACISLPSSSSSSSFSPKFKFPAKSAPSSLSALQHEQQALRALSPVSSADNTARDPTWVCNRRRIMLSIAWFGQLQGSMEGLIARAVELDTDQYTLVKEEVRKYVSKAKAAGVLRLVFHDAGTFALDDKTGGMNGSIIYELDRPENAGLKKSVKVLEKAKSELNAKQPVSWADLISVAGAEAVSICGGPTIPVSLGRLDSLSADPPERLPEETLDASGLKRSFQKKGLSTQEMVALSGAHTIGGKGFGSPTLFDNTYYKILLEKPWSDPGNMSSMVGLPSDHALIEDDECLKWIKAYANDQNLFFEDFKNAYIKLINSGANWRTL